MTRRQQKAEEIARSIKRDCIDVNDIAAMVYSAMNWQAYECAKTYNYLKQHAIISAWEFDIRDSATEEL